MEGMILRYTLDSDGKTRHRSEEIEKWQEQKNVFSTAILKTVGF